MKKNGKSFLLVVLLLTTIINSQVTNDNQFNIQDMVTNQPISVTIGGEFIVTGSFPAYSGERVDQFITRIYNQFRANLNLPTSDTKVFLEVLSKTDKYALRGIELLKKNGEKQIIDLLKFRLTGDFNYNPYLHNDDVIIFPKYDLEYNFVEISGAVNKSIKFQFVDGDKLSDAIFFARGINEAYENVNKVVVSRLSYDGNSEEEITVDIETDFTLERGDRIRVIADQPHKKSFKVLVLGEVNRPGHVFITKNSTTLKEVIDKAGGFTTYASLKDAQVLRDFNQEQILYKLTLDDKSKIDLSTLVVDDKKKDYWQILETLRMYRTANILEDDTLSFNVDNQLRILERNKLVDFTELSSPNSSASEFIVKDGDYIIVPERIDRVYVFGQVGTVGYYKFEPGKRCDYYIDKAGGLTETAKGGSDIFVIKSTSREWISIDEDYEIQPGDYIYVVKELPREFWFYISRIGTIAGILGALATIILIFR